MLSEQIFIEIKSLIIVIEPECDVIGWGIKSVKRFNQDVVKGLSKVLLIRF